MAYYRQKFTGGATGRPRIRTTLLREGAEKEHEKVSSIKLVSTSVREISILQQKGVLNEYEKNLELMY